MYKLKIVSGDINEWNTQEGQGGYIGAKGVDVTMNLESLSKQAIAEALRNNFYVELEGDDLFFGNGNTGMFSVIEDENAQQNNDIENGFIVDYAFTIEYVNPLINLEEVFGEGVA